jgi:hypothetical protein
MKFYYASTSDDYYHAVIAGTTKEQIIQDLNDQLGLEETWEITELSDLDIPQDKPIILTDGW